MDVSEVVAPAAPDPLYVGENCRNQSCAARAGTTATAFDQEGAFDQKNEHMPTRTISFVALASPPLFLLSFDASGRENDHQRGGERRLLGAQHRCRLRGGRLHPCACKRESALGGFSRVATDGSSGFLDVRYQWHIDPLVFRRNVEVEPATGCNAFIPGDDRVSYK